jgi:hypothetical protein
MLVKDETRKGTYQISHMVGGTVTWYHPNDKHDQFSVYVSTSGPAIATEEMARVKALYDEVNSVK